MQPPSLIPQDDLNELVQAAYAAPAGDLVEVGVYRGGSAWYLAGVAREQKRRLWLFDTFNGIPQADRTLDLHRKGEFSDTSVEAVRGAIPDAVIVPGVFPKTLKQAESDGLEAIAVAHIDCDQYKSVLACCQELGPLMVKGGVMIFDDYGLLDGTRQAVDEVFKDRVRFSFRGKASVRF